MRVFVCTLIFNQFRNNKQKTICFSFRTRFKCNFEGLETNRRDKRASNTETYQMKRIFLSWEAFLTDSIFETIFKLNRIEWRLPPRSIQFKIIVFVCLKIESVKQVYKENNVVYSFLDVSVWAVQKTFMFLDIYDIFQKCNLWTPTWQKPMRRAAVRCARSLIMHISACVLLTASDEKKLKHIYLLVITAIKASLQMMTKSCTRDIRSPAWGGIVDIKVIFLCFSL